MLNFNHYPYRLNADMTNRVSRGDTVVAESLFDVDFVDDKGEVELYSKIATMSPTSVFEFGFDLGHRLKSVQNIVSGVELFGIEFNSLCKTYGDRHFGKLDAETYICDVDDVPPFNPDRQYDVVFSYHRLDQLEYFAKRWIDFLWSITGKYMVLAEEISEEFVKDLPNSSYTKVGNLIIVEKLEGFAVSDYAYENQRGNPEPTLEKSFPLTFDQDIEFPKDLYNE